MNYKKYLPHPKYTKNKLILENNGGKTHHPLDPQIRVDWKSSFLR